MRARSLVAVLVLTLPQASCCTMARLFCGPDRTAWVPIDFETPEHAVRTMLEALRRDEPEVLYQCLSQDYRRRKGLDSAAVAVAWDQIRKDNPALHLAGYATVPTAVLQDADHATMHLDVEGHALDVGLVRESRWRARFRRENGTQGDDGDMVPFDGSVSLKPVDGVDSSKVTIRPVTVRHFGSEELPLDRLEFVGFERLWKVDALVMPQS